MRNVFVLCLVAACGSPTHVEVPPPAQTCTVDELDGEPLVVDLRADKRADLEAAMSRGVVAAKYDCAGVRVLTDCIAKGEYAFSGVTEKEQTVRFGSAAELRANFATNASSIDHDRGNRDVDLALAIVGTRTAQRSALKTSDFTGTCAGATHWIRSSTIGAFGLRYAARDAKSDVATIVSSGDSHDGQIAACRAAAATVEAPPTGCASPLRVTLRAIDRAEPSSDTTTRRCREGTVLTDDGECRSPNAIAYHLCDPSNLADCEAQCSKGSMGSCAIAGHSFQVGRGVNADTTRAKQLLVRACDGGSMQGCHRLGEMKLQEHAIDEARALFEKSCSTGWLPACESFGQLGLSSPAAKVDVFTVFKRSCVGGNMESCASLGKLFETGIGVQQDDANAVRLYELACNSGATRRACVSLSVMVEKGRGTPADPARAVTILEHACDGGASDSCGMLSLHYLEGRGVTRDPTKGVGLLVKACEGEDRASCFPLAMRYQAGVGVTKDADRAKKYYTRACDAGIALACEQARH